MLHHACKRMHAYTDLPPRESLDGEGTHDHRALADVMHPCLSPLVMPVCCSVKRQEALSFHQLRLRPRLFFYPTNGVG